MSARRNSILTKEAFTLDLRLLRTFQVAARHLNFHQTAEALYMSQPTVSKHIQQLESELGCELFERLGRTIRLTPAGERFTVYAGRLLEQTDAALQEFSSWLAGREQRLSVAASPMVARSILPWILRTYQERMPTVDPVISVLVSEEIPAAIANGDAEVGLSRIEPDDPRLSAELLYHDRVVFVAPPSFRPRMRATDNPAAEAETGVPQEGDWRQAILRYPMITYNHPGYWDDLLLAVRQTVTGVQTMVVTQVDITKRLVEEGLGVSFLPHSALTRELREGRLVELPVPELVLPVSASWLVVRADRPLAVAAKAFTDLVMELQALLRTQDISEILE